MNWKNRLGVYGCYLCGTAGIGFTLPFLPLYLGREGLSDRAIGWISTCAALSGLAQFPIGLWSDRLGTRKPFLVAATLLLTLAAGMLEGAHDVLWVGLLVVLFAENGICRAVVDSLSGAEVTSMSSRDEIGTALGSLRLWKPIGIIAVALFGSWWGENFGVGAILTPVAIIQGLGLIAAALIREPRAIRTSSDAVAVRLNEPRIPAAFDGPLWVFVLAMVLFHAANAPAGIYLGLYLNREMAAPDSWLAYAFVVSMVAWMLVVLPGGRFSDRIGRRPMLIVAWTIMCVRLLFVTVATSPLQIVLNQFLDGAANGLFSVVAATWVTDRLADPRRNGEAQVLVGTSLVMGSAIGPAIAAMVVDHIGYRGLFAGLAGVGAIATAVVVLFVPETLHRPSPFARDSPNESALAQADVDVSTTK